VSEETKTFAGFTTTGRLQRKNINEYLRTLDLGSFSGLTVDFIDPWQIIKPRQEVKCKFGTFNLTFQRHFQSNLSFPLVKTIRGRN
jgi:hypothetical protein